MKIYTPLFIGIFMIITQSAQGIYLQVFNKTNDDLEITILNNMRSNIMNDKKIMVPKNQQIALNSGTTQLTEIIWHSHKDGIYHNLDIGHPIIVEQGQIIIYPQGKYLIDFNKNGKYGKVMTKNKNYPLNAVEIGTSPRRTNKPTHVISDSELVPIQ